MLRIHLVDADDADCVLFAKVIGIGHGRAEENLIRIPPPDIHHLGGLNTLIEEADPAVNSSQTLLAVLVIAVLGPVAVRRRPGDNAHDFRTFCPHEVFPFVEHSPIAFRRHVVRGVGWQSWQLYAFFVVIFILSRIHALLLFWERYEKSP